MFEELRGDPETRVDTGTLSLVECDFNTISNVSHVNVQIIAVGVASLLTSLITGKRSLITDNRISVIFDLLGCVCAFRCCGNLSPSDEKSLSALMDSGTYLVHFWPSISSPPVTD